jgi:predicted amidophosphoribosyltransferase
VVLLPCKHLAACVQCSETLEVTGGVCPMCSQPFSRRVTVHGNNPAGAHPMA